MSRITLGLLGTLLSSACAYDSPPEAQLTTQALTTSEWMVSLRTDNGRYLTNEIDGGGTWISADRTAVAAWERWVLFDLNGAPLQSGDAIQLRYVSRDGTSRYLVADMNGGGPGSVAQGNRSEPREWETFIIERVGGGAIADGASIHLKSSVRPYYVCAEGGGGRAGYGSVVVDRPNALAWETFTLEVIQPQDVCPFTGTLCLFERPNFDGERFTVQALDPDSGACIDLPQHGWGARARSAANTNDRGATILPNADCTGHPIGIAAGALEPTLPLQPNAAFVF